MYKIKCSTRYITRCIKAVLKAAVYNALQNAIEAQYSAGQDAALQALQNVIAPHVQVPVLQHDAVQAAVQTVLQAAVALGNVLQDAITAQHNAGQDAALQSLQNAIAHVMHGPVVP